MRLSLDQCRVAYLVPLQRGVDQLCCIVRDIGSGAVLPGGVIPGVSGAEFSADPRWLLYTAPDESGRPCRVHLHDLNAASSSPASARPVLEECHPEFYVQLSRTKDWRFMVVNVNSKTSSEVKWNGGGARPRGGGKEGEGRGQMDEVPSPHSWLLVAHRGRCVRPRRFTCSPPPGQPAPSSAASRPAPPASSILSRAWAINCWC